jgi:RNA polymerase sigma-70 factor (ECF subfamily)
MSTNEHPLSLEAGRLAAARAGNQDEFSALVEPYRRELQLHCYRMLGSLEDAEDLVQETLLRAWRRLDTFEGRAALRTWLYKIATNACLDALDKKRRRGLPPDRIPAGDPRQPLEPPTHEFTWLEPYPDEWLPDASPSPEARYVQRESISLAFLSALQMLPPRQRAVLVLRDVLDWPAAEVAGALDLTVSAVNSALHRARVALAKPDAAHATEGARRLPSDADLRALLTRYVQAWESADVTTLIGLLRDDATFTMPPSPSWYAGHAAIQMIMTTVVFHDRWRLRAVGVNGQPGFARYKADADGVYRAAAIQVLTVTADGQIADLTTFMTPSLVERFGLPGGWIG